MHFSFNLLWLVSKVTCSGTKSGKILLLSTPLSALFLKMKATQHDSIDCMPMLDQLKTHWREITIRFAGIFIISLISVFVDFGYSQGSTDFTKAYIISFIRTALIWNGSMMIIQYAVHRFPVFTETA